jgi:hypothetical protein
MRSHLATLAAWLSMAVVVAGAAAPAPDEPKIVKPTEEEIKKAQAQIEQALKVVNGNFARVQPVTDDAVLRAFPKHLFFSVIFPQYPVTRVSPPGHSASNVYAVPRGQEGKSQLLADANKLEGLFKSALAGVQDENRAKDAVCAWLLLASVYSNDGFYKFALIDEATRVAPDAGGRKATGKMMVIAGGNGEINGAVQVSEAGKLVSATVESKLRPGPRPICQATKLLDADPIVRKMAEQDLLIMGRSARPYLDEQRARASPELQQAIDRIWKRILEEDR